MLNSIAVSPYPGKFSPIPFVGELTEQLAKASEIGFDAVELHARAPEDVPPEILNPLLSRYDLKVSAFAVGRTFTTDGLCFIDPDAAVRHALLERMNAFSQRAAELGAAIFVGYVRGVVSEDPAQRKIDLEIMADTCQRCCDSAAPLGVEYLLEPINRYEMSDFNTVQETIDFMEKVDMPNFRLLLDTFHMNIEEPSIYDSLHAAAGKFSYLHTVDSNRWAPGFGHLDFDQIAKILHEIGYDGTLSAEALPLPDPNSAARQALQVYKRMNAIIHTGVIPE
jgi:5-keto-L-gluconate epimerase